MTKATLVHTFGEPLAIEEPAGLQISVAGAVPRRCAGAVCRGGVPGLFAGLMAYQRLKVMHIAAGV